MSLVDHFVDFPVLTITSLMDITCRVQALHQHPTLLHHNGLPQLFDGFRTHSIARDLGFANEFDGISERHGRARILLWRHDGHYKCSKTEGFI